MIMRTALPLVCFLAFAGASCAGEVKVPTSYVTEGKNGKMKVVRSYAKFQVVPAKGEMQVKVGDIPYDFPRLPSQALSAALKADAKTRKFRVSWEFSGVHLNFHSTVLYDRTRNSIKYFCSGSGGSGPEYRKFYSRASLSRVTDRMIHQLANSNKGETRASGPLGPLDTETAGFTKYITRYGAKIVSSASLSQKPRPASKKLSGVYGSISLFTPDGSNPTIGGTLEAGVNYEVVIRRARDKRIVKRARTNKLYGTFKITLVPGKYILQVDDTVKEVNVGRGYYAGPFDLEIPKRRK